MKFFFSHNNQFNVDVNVNEESDDELGDVELLEVQELTHNEDEKLQEARQMVRNAKENKKKGMYMLKK